MANFYEHFITNKQIRKIISNGNLKHLMDVSDEKIVCWTKNGFTAKEMQFGKFCANTISIGQREKTINISFYVDDFTLYEDANKYFFTGKVNPIFIKFNKIKNIKYRRFSAHILSRNIDTTVTRPSTNGILIHIEIHIE